MPEDMCKKCIGLCPYDEEFNTMKQDGLEIIVVKCPDYLAST